MKMRDLILLVASVLLLSWVVAAAEYAGPKLEGTATLRSGESISGVLLTVQLGIVDGAEIGSRLRDGGYLKVATGGAERDVRATDIAALDVVWTNTGTADAPKWKITKLTVTTRSGETIVGEPTWLVHATSLIVEQPDGSQRKIYAFPLAGANFSPDNLLAKLVMGVQPRPTDVGVITPVTTPETTPATTTAPTTPPATTAAPTTTTTEVVTIEPAPTTTTPPAVTTTTPPTTTTPATTAAPATTTPAETPTITVTAPPVVTAVPETASFAAGQPVVIVFEVTNPATGKPMKVKFLLMPLPAE